MKKARGPLSGSVLLDTLLSPIILRFTFPSPPQKTLYFRFLLPPVPVAAAWWMVGGLLQLADR